MAMPFHSTLSIHARESISVYTGADFSRKGREGLRADSSDSAASLPSLDDFIYSTPQEATTDDDGHVDPSPSTPPDSAPEIVSHNPICITSPHPNQSSP